MAGTGTPGYKIEYNPPLPCIFKLGTDFYVSRYIRVCGSVPDKAQRFHIDLENSKTGDIMFHFNPRFKSNKLVVNSRTKNVWGVEEIPCTKLPFGPGDKFELEISNDGDCFSVLCNGEKFCTYKHRQPVGDIDSVNIGEDINVENFQY